MRENKRGRRKFLKYMGLVGSGLFMGGMMNGCAQLTSSNDHVKRPELVEGETGTLRIGVLDTWAGWGSLYIAQEKGFFEQQGAQIEAVPYPEYKASLQALARKRVHGAFVSFSDVVPMAAAGVPVQVVWASDEVLTSNGLVAQPDLEGVQELAGKRIGVLYGG